MRPSPDRATAAWRRAGALLAVALMLGACAAAPPERADEQAPVEEDLATILSEPLAAGEYGEPRRCVSSLSLRNFEMLGDRYILFEGPRGQYWLNELRMRCPGLRAGPASAMVFESRPAAGQICGLDRFVVADWFYEPRSLRWWQRRGRFDRDLPPGTMPCTLGNFQPVSAEQVDAVRAVFDNP
jgi:hypothetical protein